LDRRNSIPNGRKDVLRTILKPFGKPRTDEIEKLTDALVAHQHQNALLSKELNDMKVFFFNSSLDFSFCSKKKKTFLLFKKTQQKIIYPDFEGENELGRNL